MLQADAGGDLEGGGGDMGGRADAARAVIEAARAAFASAMRSGTERAATEGWMASTLWTVASRLTGAKERTGS